VARQTATKRTATKRKAPKRKPAAAKPAAAERSPAADPFETIPVLESTPAAGEFSLHDLFQQQTMEMLDRSDLNDEQKQSILVAMNCPCCGGSGLSFTMKLKRKK
jgi:hypothetical protein